MFLCELVQKNKVVIHEHIFQMCQRLLHGLKQKSISPITVNANLENCIKYFFRPTLKQTQWHM